MVVDSLMKKLANIPAAESKKADALPNFSEVA